MIPFNRLVIMTKEKQTTIKKFILFDFGYILFRTFYKTKNKHINNKLCNIQDQNQSCQDMSKYLSFRILFRENFLNFLNLIKKKHQVLNYNLIFIIEDFESDTSSNTWRTNTDPSYKSRERKRTITSFDIRYFSKLIRTEILDSLGINYLFTWDEEGDDLMYLTTKKIKEINPSPQIIIVSEDSDFSQLIDQHISMVDYYGNLIDNKFHHSKKVNLWRKIIGGDKSDGIGSCWIDNELLDEYLEKFYFDFDLSNIRFQTKNINQRKYILIDYSTAKKLINSEKEVLWIYGRLKNNPSLILNQQHLNNQKLIDMRMLPDEVISKLVPKVNQCLENYILV